VNAGAPGFPGRLERFESVDSTQRIVRDWLDAGVPEVAVAVADVQTSGRGRHGRSWRAPPGAALLLSAGFRPTWLPLARSWQLAATVSLAMLDAAEEAAGLRDNALGLKWPNDLVAGDADRLLKVAGVLGEAVAEADRTQSAVVGIGVNVDWRSDDFPAELADSMSSLREVAGRPVDREALLAAFLARLEPRYEALRLGRFDSGGWSARQRQTGRAVEVVAGDSVVRGMAAGVDPATGALLLVADGRRLRLDTGEVTRCRVRSG
jgi:BirA family biotin operon repressor/biotin-[acetyl-CoA-carboxylase] ligase